jgi:hypothetical protein
VQDRLPRADVLTGIAHVVAGGDLLVDDDRAVLELRQLLTDDGVGARGHDRAGRDANRGAMLDPRLPEGSRARLADDLQRYGRVLGVGGDDGEAVHPGRVEGRQVGRRDGVLGQHAAERVVERDRLVVQARELREHEVPRVFDRDPLGFGAHRAARYRSARPFRRHHRRVVESRNATSASSSPELIRAPKSRGMAGMYVGSPAG